MERFTILLYYEHRDAMRHLKSYNAPVFFRWNISVIYSLRHVGNWNISVICRVVHGTNLSVPFPSHSNLCLSRPIPWDVSHGIPIGIPFPWTSLVICLTAVLKLARIVFFSLYFQTFWPKWLNLFPSFQKRFGPWPKKKTQLCTIGWPQCTIGWPLVWCETDLQFDAWPHGDTFQLL